ncbi:antigen KI-67 isoform A [Patagioenas fasciata monilis]|uniref:Antigen KI-67 isoform A n=1 Tax=Patagioenas fasciata monilis TaxID=372326 RepID=A0A1V4KHV2_PATFA|nr:antigen KI-67 isoform A [Patagioenas fasciata monilis]
MPLFGNIIVIKRNGTDGIAFPLTASSCLFGRRTECDIRIQLPQVSKEHCKIEVNENKEAILTNLSTVNPTQLNGGCFQQPVPLKHGDVLTIIDRSFRFEYPLQSTPRKRRSRSPKAETLQVLHVQQVAEVELSRKQTSGSKSLPASDNGECEGKHGNENKQNTEENISKSVPIKPQTPKSSHRIHQSIGKQNEQSPFSELCEKLRREITVKKPLHKGNESPKAAKEDGRRVLPEPGAQISSSTCVYDLGSQNEKELGRSENVEECKRKVEPDVICSELNRISAAGSAARKSFTRSPRISGSKEVSRTTGKRSDVQDHREPSTAGRSKDTEITPKASKEKDGNAAFSRQLCTIQRLDYPDKIPSSAVVFGKPAPTTNTANVSGVDKCVLSTPTSRRKSLRSQFISPTKETSGENPVNADTPIRRGASLKPESVSEISTETQREDLVWRSESPKQLPLTENKCLKQRRNSKQRTPGKLVQDEVPKEIYDQANAVNSKEECPETPASYRNSKSPRRNNRQSQELSNKSFHSEKLAWEGLTPELASPASQKSGSGRKRSRARWSSGLQTGEALEANAGQEHHDTITDRKDSGTKEEAVAKGGLQRQDSEDAGVTGRRRLSSKRRSSGSVVVPKDNAAASEMSISGLLAGEGSGKMKSISQKRKSADLLLQPLGKRKRVSFGGHLSPELFDKSLPPNSPLKRGATPARRSVPFGNSPRAVLKKSQGSKLFMAQELSEHSQKEKMSPKNLPNQKSPTASSPVSGKATPTFTLNSPATYTKGRFSICCITAPLPIAEEKDAVADDVNTKGKNGAQVKTPKSSPINQHDKSILKATPDKLTRSAQLALKVTPLKRRSGAVAIINAKRRSGASSANLLVAKSWAEVVKLGVARPQSKTVKKSVRKGRSVKKITKSPKTPERKIKSHFSTGHAESPATIVVGRAYSTTVRTAGRVPKVIKNPVLKLNMNMDESFTGMTEMFQTPEDKSGKALPLATVQKADFTPTGTAMEMSDLHTPEETGEMMVSPLNNSDASEQKQDSPGFCHFLREKSLKSVFDAIAIKTPEKGKAVLEENNSVDSLTIPDEHVSRVKSGRKRRTPKQKLEPVEALSGIKELMKTPKQRSEPAETLLGVKELMKTPKQRPEPVEALSGIKELMKTPKQTSEPVEPLSGIKYLLRTPKQKSEPVEVLSGIKRLMRTPQQKAEPVEVLSGIKKLMETPQQELEPVTDATAFRRLLKTPKEAGKAVGGVTLTEKTPKLKYQPVEDMIGVSRLFKTPKENVEPIEDVFGISRLVKTPKEKSQPVDDFVGLQRLMAEPRQKSSNFEVDYVGVTEMFDTPEEMKVKSVNVMDSKEEDTAPPCIDSSDQNEDKGNISQARQREKSLNVKELQGLEKTPTQEETEETSTSASAPKNKGRGRRAKDCIQEEIGSTLPEQEKVETVSFVEPHGIAPRPARVLRNEPANMKQILQEYGISDIAETEDAPTVNTISVSGSTQHENGQLQTGLKKAENESNEGGGEDSEEIFLSPGKRSRGVKKVENTDPLIPPKRGRRAKNDQVKQAASEDVRGTRRLCKDPSTKVMQKDEQTFDKDAETATTEESENRAELEIKTTEKRVMSLRSDRKHSAEAKADVCETALENTQTVEKTQETSAKTDSETQSHLKNEIEVSQEDEAANAQENITEASRRLKAASPSGGTKEILVTALNLEANRSAGGETNRTRKRRGKNDLLDKKTVNNLEVITPKFKSETEMDESSLKDSLGSACVKNPHQVTKDQGDPTGTSIPAANGDSLARGHQKRTRSEQKILKTNQTDILQENQAENHGMACKRGRKVQFVLEEASSKAVGDESSPEDGKGMTYKDNQHQTSENPSSQVRRSRRKQVDSMPPIACPTFMEKQTSIADQSQGEALVKEQDSALGAAPSSTEEQPLRRGKRREVAAAPTSTSLPIRRRRGLLEGDDRKTTMREDQNPALGNQTLQAKANASARGRRKKIDAVAEVKSSSLLQEQCGLSETGDKEESTNEEQNVPLETVSCAKEKPLGRGRRKGTALASQTTNYISLRGKSGLPADSGREETPKEDQNVPLESSDSSVKENKPRKGRRKEDVILLEATSSTQEKQGLSKASGRKSNREAKKLNLENSVSQEKMDLSKGNSGQTTTSLADSSTSLQGLPEDGKKETPEEPQNVLLEAAPSAKENPSRAGRKKAISSKSEETSSTYLREKPALPQERRRKRILQESEDASLENNSAQEKTRQLRNKRKKVEFQAEAATLISIHKNSDLPENDGASETQNVRLASTRSEKDLQPGEGTKGISPGQAAAATSRRRKLPFPAEDLASKKPKSEKDANGALQKGKRNQTREEPGEGAAKAARAAGGTDRRTRSSVRTRK